ncbi:MAG TPA: hypothetical protein VE442_04305 [Jatrophihabitans sp.]|nr:hypothetical protein [Jatrophihabitans sp.]
MTGRLASSEAHTVVVTKRDGDGKPSNVERWRTSRNFEVIGGHLVIYDSTHATSPTLIAAYAPGDWLTVYIDTYADT